MHFAVADGGAQRSRQRDGTGAAAPFLSGGIMAHGGHIIGLDHFWEQADDEGSAQNPLERELAERLDALARYRELILDMEASNRSYEAEVLLRQHDREYQAVQRLWSAIRRGRERAPAHMPERA